MATYTDHYNLEKPAQTDIYNVDVFNDNADIVDSVLFGKSDLSNLGEVETSATASRSYAVGENLVYNGILYKVTTAIAAGGTITPNSNVSQVNVGDQLSAINAYVGPAISVPIEWSEVGWSQSSDVTIPQIAGKTLVGVLLTTGTYRLVGLTPQITDYQLRVHFYARNTSITSSGVTARPVYI